MRTHSLLFVAAFVAVAACGGSLAPTDPGGIPPGITGTERTATQASALTPQWSQVYTATTGHGNVTMKSATEWYCGLIYVDNGNGNGGNGQVTGSTFIGAGHNWYLTPPNGAGVSGTVQARCVTILSFGPNLRGIVTLPTQPEFCAQGGNCVSGTGVDFQHGGAWLNEFYATLNGNPGSARAFFYGNDSQQWDFYETSGAGTGGVTMFGYLPLFTRDATGDPSWIIGLNEVFNPRNTLIDANTAACFLSGVDGDWTQPTYCSIAQNVGSSGLAAIGSGSNPNTECGITCVILNY